jgi:hypothetical protein
MAEIGVVFDFIFIWTTGEHTSQKWHNSFSKQMTSCGFQILLPPQIWLLLTFGYSSVLKPPSQAKFDEPELLLDAITEFLDARSVEELRAVFDEWVERVRWVSKNEGIYYQA